MPTSSQTAPKPSLADLDTLYKGFADPTRLRIMNLLAAGEMCVCDIVTLLDLPQSTVSRHLGYLLRSELVTVERGPRFAYYRLAESADHIHQNLINCVRTCFRGIGSLDAERALAEDRVHERRTKPC